MVIELFQNQYLDAGFILLVSVLIAFIIHIVLSSFKKTGDIVRRCIKPLYFLIIIAGLYFAVESLSVFDTHMLLVRGVFFVLGVLAVSWMVSRVSTVFIDRWLEVHRRFKKTPALLNKIIFIVIFVIAGMVILSYFDVEITPLLTALGVGGLAVGLALQDTLSNFFAGLHIISDRPVNVGDFVELPSHDIKGHVKDIGWRSTRIKTLPNNIVVIPNAKLAESVIKNESALHPEMSVLVNCGVAYESDLEKVEKVTLDVAKGIQKKVKGALKSYKPLLFYGSFGDSNIDFTVVLRAVKPEDQWTVKHEFIKALKKRYDKDKIEIAWPVRKIYYADAKGKLKN